MINVPKINKPIYGTYIAIRDKYLNQAIKLKTDLRVTIPQGTYIVNPKKWIKTGRKQEKVFLIPDQPMILWENHCQRFPKEQTPIEDSVNPIEALKGLAETPGWNELGKKLHSRI
jgi:hypothetical protein